MTTTPATKKIVGCGISDDISSLNLWLGFESREAVNNQICFDRELPILRGGNMSLID